MTPKKILDLLLAILGIALILAVLVWFVHQVIFPIITRNITVDDTDTPVSSQQQMFMVSGISEPDSAPTPSSVPSISNSSQSSRTDALSPGIAEDTASAITRVPHSDSTPINRGPHSDFASAYTI